MKQCPACKTTYTDDTLSYCLADGKPLVPVVDEHATIVNRTGEATAAFGGGERMRVDIPQETVGAAVATPKYVPTALAPSSGGGLKIFVGLLAVFVLLAVIVIAGGIAFYFGSKSADITPKNNPANRTPSPAPSATTNGKDDLREQIANLEKRLNEQKSANRPANIPLTLPNQPATTTTARVNSPGDGFLALRSLPNSEAGERILKIPHGAVISIGACGPVSRPVSRSGRWCQASYNGYSGWVFDAYLVY